MPTGTLVLPAASDVRSGVQYGASGTEFTGTYTAIADYPIVGDVEAGVIYGFGTLTGTFAVPVAGDVRFGTEYGAAATEFTGTLVVPLIPGTDDGITAEGHNDLVEEAVRAAIDDALPDNWNVYARRDMNLLGTDQWPMVYVVGLNTTNLEEMTDNESVIGYPQAVWMGTKEASVKRTDPDLIGLRRIAQQAVYKTNYPLLSAQGLTVETVMIDEELGTPPPPVGAEVTWMGFMVTVGILESREVETP